MGSTITEKIIAYHAGRNEVKQGELVTVAVDLVLANDITAPLAIQEIKKSGIKEVFDKNKIVLVPDHFAPNKDIKSAEQCKMMREFARDKEIVNYFEIGEMGVEHALIPEKGLVKPGDLIIGADSHTCTYGALGAFSTGMGSTDIAAAMAIGKTWLKVPTTLKVVFNGVLGKYISGKDLILRLIGEIGVDGARYKALEFTGEAIRTLSMDSRFTMCNMAIEAGGKNGVIEVDDKTKRYLNEVGVSDYEIIKSDNDAEYEKVIEIDCDILKPQVAAPFSPANSKNIEEYKNIAIDQVVIGSCTNGRMEDLRVAAEILKGNKRDKNVRLIVIPATQKIYRQALAEGLIETFIDSGAAVSTPTCGPCLGGHMGILAKGEKAVATTNRNFRGRMGDVESEVYLSGPAVAASSAITGKISSPEEVVS